MYQNRENESGVKPLPDNFEFYWNFEEEGP